MKHLLLRRIPLMTSLCTLLSVAAPKQEAFASPADFEFYQQATPLKTVLNLIGSHYKVTILFEESLVQNKTTSYKFDPSRTTIDKALQELLTPLGLKASKVNDDNYAIISAAPKKSDTNSPTKVIPTPDQPTSQPETVFVLEPPATTTAPTEAFVPAGMIVKGRVIADDKEQPVPNAIVTAVSSIKTDAKSTSSTRNTTVTDAEGYFTLRMPAEAKALSISHINYLPQAVNVDGRGLTVVRMKVKVKEIENVVVTTGLFKRSKETFTGATTSVTGDQIREVNGINALDALKIFDPAIRITDNNIFGSDPNKLPNITLRGTNNFPQQVTGTNSPTSGADFMANYSNNPNQPLFILDGFEVSLQKIYDLDITRIANFTILKDAAATSIYGSRAANGVIVVDTKQPAPGKLRVSYSGLLQIAAPDLTVYDLTNAEEKLEVERLAGVYSQYASGIRPDADAFWRQLYSNRKAQIERGVNTYWLAQPVQTGFGQRHSVYLEGGDNAIRYGIDLSYNDNVGTMKNSKRQNYEGGMYLSYRYKGLLFKNVLTVGFNKATNSNYGSFSDYTKLNPYWSPFDTLGNYAKVLETYRDPISGSIFTFTNPLYNTTINTKDQSTYTNILNQTNLEWLIGKGFRLTGKMQINTQNDESDYFLPAQHTSFINITDFTKKGSYTKGEGKFFSYDGTLQVDYSKRFGKHQLMNSTGGSISQTDSKYLSIYVEGFGNDQQDQISFGNGYPPNSRPSYVNNITRRVSGFTNFNYSYNNRYNADLSVSTDGSSQFGSKKRFGTFWSAGASWNLHKEKFLSDKKYITLARLRGSIGTTGDNKFQPFMGITTYQYYTDQNYRGQVGAVLMGFGNENLQWQQTLKKNIGLDLGVLNNRINISFDVYQENTSNLILDVTTPPSVGFGSYKDNTGEIENKGYEFKLNAYILRQEKRQMYWTVFFNGNHNKDHIKKISNSLSKLNQTNDKNDQTRPQFRYEEGMSLNAIWAVQSLGIDPSNGRELYLKRDGTITYNWDPVDKVIVGNTVPDLRGNFGTNFSWKGLSLGLYFSYEFGGQLYNQTLADRVEVTSFTYNVDKRVLIGRWKKPGDETYFKGLADENGRPVTSATNLTSRFVQDNNYVNAESISLGYTLSQKLNRKLHLSNTRVSFIATDIKRWSSIEIERGTSYPFARNFTVNISTSF